MSLGPTARRRRLGSLLTEVRTAAHRSVQDAADQLDCSEGKIRNWETGRSGIKKVELSALLDYYGAPEDVRGQLEELRREGAKRGWWSTYRLPDWFKPYVGLEQAASEVRNFEIELVPGLLQTEAYAREIHSTGRHITDPADIDKRVAARMARQQRLTAEPPLELRAVVAEAALHRRVGSADVMAEQLDHLIALSKLPNVIVQVLTYEAGTHPSMTGGFTVLSFAEPTDPDVGFADNPLGGHVIDEAADVAALNFMFDELRSLALPTQDSLRLVTTIHGEHASR
ncbi:helix-turn-helix domain-containing protein [Actinoalloteichus sp. GBA129-24]|uniref:helix-turn-helix domain-containing protein n=1 Tax=Actinoalloteichus sp. GBA129-24 TaxID=1612551 RepID=UPI0009504120|nr:helix-turn-helix transcriptional regulator [Actinoalloteichus sp. GBA129-24]APU22281.1 DNA binding protein with helix-turn-helix domain [Actinoalloteichus sp. GBA129-24]